LIGDEAIKEVKRYAVEVAKDAGTAIPLDSSKVAPPTAPTEGQLVEFAKVQPAEAVVPPR